MKAHRLSSNTRWKFYTFIVLQLQQLLLEKSESKNKKEWEAFSNEMLNMNKDDSLILYKYVYDEPYTHLDLDTLNNKIYKNFNLLEISE